MQPNATCFHVYSVAGGSGFGFGVGRFGLRGGGIGRVGGSIIAGLGGTGGSGAGGSSSRIGIAGGRGGSRGVGRSGHLLPGRTQALAGVPPENELLPMKPRVRGFHAPSRTCAGDPRGDPRGDHRGEGSAASRHVSRAASYASSMRRCSASRSIIEAMNCTRRTAYSAPSFTKRALSISNCIK